jgi:hypothetical protein
MSEQTVKNSGQPDYLLEILHNRSAAVRAGIERGVALHEWESICQHFGPLCQDDQRYFWVIVRQYIETMPAAYTESEYPLRASLSRWSKQIEQKYSRLPSPGHNVSRYPMRPYSTEKLHEYIEGLICHVHEHPKELMRLTAEWVNKRYMEREIRLLGQDASMQKVAKFIADTLKELRAK